VLLFDLLHPKIQMAVIHWNSPVLHKQSPKTRAPILMCHSLSKKFLSPKHTWSFYQVNTFLLSFSRKFNETFLKTNNLHWSSVPQTGDKICTWNIFRGAQHLLTWYKNIFGPSYTVIRHSILTKMQSNKGKVVPVLI